MNDVLPCHCALCAESELKGQRTEQRHVPYAKSSAHGETPPTVTEHCDAVAETAAKYGKPIGMEKAAWICGLFHDFGKYGELFQQVLQGKVSGIDHAAPGAALLMPYMPKEITEVVAGHHAGLISKEAVASYLKAICKGDAQAIARSGKIPSLSGAEQMKAAMKEFTDSHPAFRLERPELPEPAAAPETPWKNKLLRMMQTRMLLSCQVDADYSVSAYESDGNGNYLYGKTIQDATPTALVKELETYRSQICAESKATKSINELRDTVYRDCSTAGKDMGHNFWTLTAPTGAGKTLGMLKFALERAAADAGKQRIILVLPFLSLVDQTAKIVNQIIPGTVVDTSQTGLGDKDRDRTEKWDASCIITTSVQFFDSLFSDRPGDCRKLHNMANSIVVFDEVQSLPHSIARFAMQSLYWLSSIYHSCIVLSTATQPQYQILPELDWGAREIIRDVPGAFRMSVQKKFEFLPQETELGDIAADAGQYDNVCVVCNLKRHALAVYHAWEAQGLKNIYLLSTSLCPAHRMALIDEIKTRQKAGDPVHVAATQCIEAGVDFDFEKMYRALGPLTSLVQAAGRQNRNGRYSDEPMTVFIPAKQKGERMMYPGPDYEKQAMIVRTMQLSGYDMTELASIEEYYRRLFRQYREPDGLWNSMIGIEYEIFAEEAKLIKQAGFRVIVPYAGEQAIYNEVLTAAHEGRIGKKHLSMAAIITVQTYDRAGVSAHCQELVIHRHNADYPTGVYILLEGHEDCYNSKTGLELSGKNAAETFFM